MENERELTYIRIWISRIVVRLKGNGRIAAIGACDSKEPRKVDIQSKDHAQARALLWTMKEEGETEKRPRSGGFAYPVKRGRS